MRFLLHESGRRLPIAALGALLLVILALAHRPVRADVIVLANRTGTQITVQFQAASGPVQHLTLPADEVRPMFVDGPASIEFVLLRQVKRYQLDPQNAYFFGRDASGRVDMQKIGLGRDALVPRGRLPGTAGGTAAAVIPVKILVDEEEPARQFLWERRLRQRIDAASAILQRYARVQFQVVGVGTWNSDNAISDFDASLREFEAEVNPFPAHLAIGFTSQFPVVRGRVHMAGTHGPLRPHILIREGSPEIDEAERLEFLVHELGHYLGASHSPEKDSVMRPVLGDNRAGRRNFEIRFDPVNTLILAMVGEEIRRRNVRQFSQLTAGTKHRLQEIYTALTRAMPNDPAGEQFQRLSETAAYAPLVAGAKRVLRVMVHSAVVNRALPEGGIPLEGRLSRRSGDALTEHLVREAAAAADSLPDDVAPAALLLTLAVGLDDSSLVLSHPTTRIVVQGVETPQERTARLAVLGEPTLQERRDVARRFFTSAYLASAIGAEAAREATLAAELRRVKGTGRFSFALLAADRAGIRFGEEVMRGRVKMLAGNFSTALVLPPLDGQPDALTAEQLARYGAPDGQRFRQQLFIIDQLIGNLPLYRTSSTPSNR